MEQQLETLANGVSIVVDEHCRISEDGILLARFAAPQPTDTACDLGSGNGIIPLYWYAHKSPARCVAVEREAAFAALAHASVAANNAHEKITVMHADWNALDAIPAASMTLVTCNPPYFAYNASRPSPDPLRRAARQEDSPAMLTQLCRAAKRLLADDGRFCLCHRPERLDDVFAALREADLKPCRLQFVHTRDGDAPWLFLLESRSRGTLQVAAPLIRHTRGTHTAVYRRLYR